MTDKKIKILTMGDHPLVASGVGCQCRYIFEGLLKTGKYKIISLGGAMKHANYQPIKIQEYGDDWLVFPVDGYGNEQMVREIMEFEKPDAIWFMTDPRFYGWLFNMSDEIRDRGIPLLYYHVWDENPVPMFNKPYYDSCDYVGCISNLTYNILQETGHKNFGYIPHAVDAKIFKPCSQEEKTQLKERILGKDNLNKFVYFYNSRNARRKMTSDVIRFFKETLDLVGPDKAFMFMHADPFDQEGANLLAVAQMLGLKETDIGFSTNKISTEEVANFYKISDCTVNLSNNEGFGLSSLESLMCGVPVISVRTGGLQDQNYQKLIDGTEEEFGVSLFPKTKSLTGSQQIPWIYDCRCTDEDIVNAYLKMYHMPEDQRKELGKKCCEHANKNFKLDEMIGVWDNAIEKCAKLMKENGNLERIKFEKV